MLESPNAEAAFSATFAMLFFVFCRDWGSGSFDARNLLVFFQAVDAAAFSGFRACLEAFEEETIAR
mgnify:CR=1 FL=1